LSIEVLKKSVSKSKGFTFIELMVASIIGAFIAVVGVGVLKAVSSSAEKANGIIERSSHMKYAVNQICLDLANIYRGRRAADRKLCGRIDEESGSSVLTFYTVSRSKARLGQPEGDVYEVEYYLLVSAEEGKSSLMRRLWPNPDKESEPGGILTVIAEDVSGFFVRYYDGGKWRVEWAEDSREMPELVEVSIIEGGGDEANAMVKSFFVNLVSGSGGQMDAFSDEQDQDAEETNDSQE